MSEINVDTIKDAAGLREFFPCTAWVNFNGTGTVAIRDSGNVSSITDNGTGNYTINFVTAMDDGDYSVSGLCHYDGVSDGILGASQAATLISSCGITCSNSAGALGDKDYISAQIFGGS